MQVGTYQLLETRTDQIDAHHEYVEALRDYWVARSELELAVGRPLARWGILKTPPARGTSPSDRDLAIVSGALATILQHAARATFQPQNR
jgi:hypothetical protein